MQLFQPKNILITGGAGFIGANFIHYLLAQEQGIKVINLDLLTYAGSLTHLAGLVNTNNYQFIQGDIRDLALAKQLLAQHQIDTIIHFAAESHVDRSITNPGDFITTNVIGTFSLLEAARQFWLEQQHWDATKCRFHHISTDEVYGSLNLTDPAFVETSCYAPNSPYSASKAGSDHLVRAYHHTYGLPVTTSNCSNNYGPFQHPEKLIPTIINSCLAQKSIPIYGDGSNVRDWLFVKDHCDGILTIVKKGDLGEVYNIGGNNEWSNLNLVTLICDTMDKLRPQQQPHSKLIKFVPDRLGHDWRYAINCTKIKTTLNWEPTTDFYAGLKETIQFYSNEACAINSEVSV